MMTKEQKTANRAKGKKSVKRPVESVRQGPLTEHEEPDLLALQRALADPAMATPAGIAALQRTVGNRAATRSLAQAHQEVVVQRAPTDEQISAFIATVIGPACRSVDDAFGSIVSFAKLRGYDAGATRAFDVSAERGEPEPAWNCESLSDLAMSAFRRVSGGEGAVSVQLEFGVTGTSRVLSAPGLRAAVPAVGDPRVEDESQLPNAGPRYYFASHRVVRVGEVWYDPLMGQRGVVRDWWPGYVEKRSLEGPWMWYIGDVSGPWGPGLVMGPMLLSAHLALQEGRARV